MRLPAEIQAAIDKMTPQSEKELIARAKALSLRYREETGRGERLLSDDTDALVYAHSRMPATYAAALSVMKSIRERMDARPKTMLDAGAGTGSAALAAASVFDLSSAVCLERESAMLKVGKALCPSAIWQLQDLRDRIDCESAEMVISAYALGEMTGEDRIAAAKRLYAKALKYLVIIEPGTPKGAESIKEVRSALAGLGAHIIAPCPSGGACPLENGEWCAFSARVERMRLHRLMKGGDAPYEDEKFCYICFSREEAPEGAVSRVLRHPYIEKGRITVRLCEKGGVKDRIITKKENAAFKAARKCEAGDDLNAGARYQEL